jgi:hypothetical protein
MPDILLRAEAVELSPEQSVANGTPVTLAEIMDAAGGDIDAKIVTPSYIAVLTQEGGCDYTIGCGVKIKRLRATSLEAAMAEVESIIENDYGASPECRIDGVTLYETTACSTVNIQAVYAQIAAKQKAEEDAEEEDEERAEFERLSQKYGRP